MMNLTCTLASVPPARFGTNMPANAWHSPDTLDEALVHAVLDHVRAHPVCSYTQIRAAIHAQGLEAGAVSRCLTRLLRRKLICAAHQREGLRYAARFGSTLPLTERVYDVLKDGQWRRFQQIYADLDDPGTTTQQVRNALVQLHESRRISVRGRPWHYEYHAQDVTTQARRPGIAAGITNHAARLGWLWPADQCSTGPMGRISA